MRNVVAVILGGGRGTRLFPLTKLRCKPAVPIGGKYRLIDIPISNCVNDGIRQILVLSQYNSESLNRHIAQTYRFDRFTNGFVSILAAEQTYESVSWFQGTADAVRKSMIHILSLQPDLVLILSGDQLYRMNFLDFIGHFSDTSSDICIASKPVPRDEASGLGIIQVDSAGEIMGFHEKPSPERLSGLESSSEWVPDDQPFLGSMGIYLFKPKVLSDLLTQNPEHDDFGKEIIPCALGRYRMTSFPFRGYWSDIGTIKSFFKANIDLAMPDPAFDMYSQFSPLYTRARALPGARMRNCTLHNAIVCDASDLNGADVRNSVVGIRSYLGKGCILEDTVLMGADFWRGHPQDPATVDPTLPPMGVGEGSVIRRAIIDKNARIGSNVRLLNEAELEDADGDSWFIRDGIIVIPKGAVIPDGTVV